MPFDLIVDVREPKTGKIINRIDYVLHISKDGSFYERPPGSGTLYNMDGSLHKGPEKVQDTGLNTDDIKARAQSAIKKG